MSELSNYLDFAKELAEESGKIMLHYFSSSDLNTRLKDDLTRVTMADTKINDLVIQETIKRFPGHSVLGEEASSHNKSDYLWVCDPIDGTLPYSLGIPISTFNLALVHRGESIVAVQKDPFTGRLLWASKGMGTFLDGDKLKMTGNFLGRRPVNCEIYAHEYNSLFNKPAAEKEIWEALRSQDFVLMKLISVAVSVGLVATGELAAAIFSNTHTFEAATGSLLVIEAGGKFTSLFGETEKYNRKINGFIAAPMNLHQQILDAIKPIAQKYKIK